MDRVEVWSRDGGGGGDGRAERQDGGVGWGGEECGREGGGWGGVDWVCDGGDDAEQDGAVL